MRFPALALVILLLAPHVVRAGEAALAAAEAALRDRLLSAAELQFSRIAADAKDPAIQSAALLGLARSRLAAGKTAEAQQALQSLPADIPAAILPRVRLVRADAALALGDASAARPLLETPPPADDPAAATLHARLWARLLLAESKGEEAVLFLRKQLEASPDSPGLRLELAQLFDRLDRPAEAEVLWTALAALPPRSLEAQTAVLRLAETEAAQGKPGAAARIQTLVDAGGLLEEVEARAYPILAGTLEAGGKFEEAQNLLEALEKRITDPATLTEIRIRRAHLLVQAGKLDEGRQLISRHIAAHGDHPLAALAQLRLARALSVQTNSTATALAYETYLSVFSDPEGQLEARLALAGLQENREAWAEASVLYDQAWHNAPPDSPLRPHILLKRADMLAAQNKNEAARELYLQLAQTWPEHDLVPQALFQAAISRSDLDPALDELSRLRSRHPNSPFAERALLQQAVLLNRAVRLERALGAYDAYLDRYPGGIYVVDAITDKGLAAYRLGFFDLALRQFELVLEKYPEHLRAEQATCMRAWALFLTGRDEDAVRTGRAFLQKYPSSPFVPDMRFWLGELAFNRGDFESAEKEFAALAGNGSAPGLRSKALYLAGRAALARRAFADALARFTQSIEIEAAAPHAPDALFHLGDALTELNRFDEAITTFDQLITQHPASHLVHAARGRKGDCHFTLGEKDPERFRQALASYRLVEESSAAAPGLRLQAAYKVGKTLQALERREEARAQYLRVVHSFLNDRARMGSDAEDWFVRAVTDAAQSFEQAQQWREAIQVYRSLAEARLPQSPEATRRIENLRREHRILF